MKTKLILCLALVLSSLVAGCDDAGRALTESEVSCNVAAELMGWGIFGPTPPEKYARMEKSVAGKIRGVRGFTISDGFHGDGTDWYEVELSPELAAELRTAFSRSSDFKKEKPMYWLNGDKFPSWWPTQWPADAQCYYHEKWLMYFILPDSSTRAWFIRYRT